MSIEIAKKRGRPKKVVEVDGDFPSELSSDSGKLSTPKKSTKQTSSTIAASKKSIGSKSKETKAAIPKSESKAKAAPIAKRTSPKPTSKTSLEPPPPEVLKAIAKKEPSKIVQQIAFLRAKGKSKEESARLSTPPPTSYEPTYFSKQLSSHPTIPSTQSSIMPFTTIPTSVFYQWLPNPPSLTPHKPTSATFRALSTTSTLHASKFVPKDNSARRAKALNRLATEASIPKAKDGLKGGGFGKDKGLNPGGFPVTYKSATRRVTAIIVAAPVALCMSWFLYERCELPTRFFLRGFGEGELGFGEMLMTFSIVVLGVEQKKLVPDTTTTTTTGKTVGESTT
jgi:hypothetical protein